MATNLMRLQNEEMRIIYASKTLIDNGKSPLLISIDLKRKIVADEFKEMWDKIYSNFKDSCCTFEEFSHRLTEEFKAQVLQKIQSKSSSKLSHLTRS